jgi:hypothetical protein
MVSFSLLKILILTIIDFSIGFFWYSDYGFSQAWVAAMGTTKENIIASNPNVGKLMSIQMILNLISVAIHSFILITINPTSLLENLTISFLLWLGFTANVQLNPCLWEGKPIKLFFINTGYKFTTIMTFSVLFYLF